MIRSPRLGAPNPRLERVLERIEHTRFFDRLGEILGTAFVRLVRPGPVKDGLSGSWMSHPLHPALTDVTIGSWTSAMFLDLAGEDAASAADALVGIGVLSAVPTAVTGLSDLADITEDDQRAAGGAHALGNISAVVLYGLSYLARKLGRRRAGVGLAFAGGAVASAAGLLGGHLAFRKGVGVDQTAFQVPFDEWTPAMPEKALEEGKPQRVMVEGVDVLLVRDGAGIFAVANRCSHRGGPLNEGDVEDGTVTCPWHGSMFRLDDGSVLAGPATAPQPRFELRIRDDVIEVRTARRAS